jgi:unsaturated chondroitin disaccharide hydrolase
VRGHSWAIYGFGSAYARTGDHRFLRTAELLADAYIERTNGELPPNDWEDPAPESATEASAASIAAAGLAQLAELSGAEATRYRDNAIRIITLLSDPEYLASDNTAWDGLIQHATYHRGNNLGVDESVMWGDYYYLEAVDRLLATKGR